ncbi:MAG: phosphoribosylglycinamide formyltransferase [Deltaproteobacteria bacterium]|nr:MAG: phosphoribosylglycinamide formyltransferase [Deltaproteobacteria bacterium]
MTPIDVGVLISGRGSNLQAILDAIAADELAARVRVVISNRPKAAGLERAAAAGVPTQFIGHRQFPDRESFDAALVEALRAAQVSWVVLAGFMRILTPVFLDAFPNRVVNIHPALLPAFPGVDAQTQALAYGVRVTGCTVHLVNEGVDTGPVLAQAAVPVLQDDDHDSLAARILEQEHRLLVETLQRIALAGLTVGQPPESGGRPKVRFGSGP